jgi:hypothetical protein
MGKGEIHNYSDRSYIGRNREPYEAVNPLNRVVEIRLTKGIPFIRIRNRRA